MGSDCCKNDDYNLNSSLSKLVRLLVAAILSL